ncbi:hypothetical protein [uncultured Mitsuokella sp.]|uniref:hypothetical protein n=1 Tax=uncultured Mitsuokella sp. TaxID=453120 RepID=UPI00266F6A22|nr:hypothetical protein [uncultured Mitsuokella sp.]
MPNRKEKKARHIFTEKTGLEQEITALKQNLDEQAAKLKDCRKEIEDAIVARIQYQEELKNLREENRSLKRRLAIYEPEILADEQEKAEVTASAEPESDAAADEAGISAEEREFFETFRIYVVGGTDKWQKKAAEVFPMLHFLGNEKNFDPQALAQADYVVINTNAVSHACTEKAKNAAPKSAAIIMTSNNNLKLLRQKLLATLG